MNPSSSNKINQTDSKSVDLLALIRTHGENLRMRPEQLRQLHMDSSFDSDLGLDSLTRMEMLVRIQDHFDVALSEEVYARIETPRDLWREIQSANPQHDLKITFDPHTTKQDTIDSVAYDAETLLDVLDWHVRTHPDRVHITLYSDQDDGEKITFRDLQKSAEIMAVGLQENDLKPEQPVAIMLPTSKDYFLSFFAILMAGGIPVPLYPPTRRAQIEEHLLRHQRILDNCQAVILITIGENKQLANTLTAQLTHLQKVITPEELKVASGTLLQPRISGQDIAFLQYTSGSTGTPKGVVLTHHNLLSNVHAMGERVGAKSSDVYVSWLPLYHDMGLIGAWFGSLYYSMHLVVMSPLSFLARPSRWLSALHRYRGTLTGAPNFAYELCLQRIKGSLLKEFDLSSVRCIFNGAEPISPVTLQRFNEHFKTCDLKETAMQPVYGLAECSVGLTFPDVKRTPLIDQIERITFMKTGHAVPDTGSLDALQFPACGIPLTGHEIRIVDPDGRELPERRQGTLEFRGPSTTSGYFRNPEQSRKLFHDDWLNSGDLAYLANGELYLTGRVKDIIIHAGRNIYPHELEQAVGALDGIRNGCVAVFGSQNTDSGTERLIVLAESKIQDSEAQEKIITQVNGIASALIGSPADEVVLAPSHTILKTSSGKIRRSACRDLYEQGKITQSSGRNIPLFFSRMLWHTGFPTIKRWYGSAITWLYSSYAWTLLLLTASYVWPLVVICPDRWSWPIMRFGIRMLTFASQTKISVQGLENIKTNQGPFIFACNHSSYLDGLVLIYALPVEFSFVAKAELEQQLIAGKFLRKMKTEFVERFDTQQSINDSKKVSEAISAGRSLLFFPEGTFTRMPGLLPFRMGAFSIAATTNRPIIPIAVRGTRSILRAHTWMPRKGSVKVTIGETIPANTHESDSDQSAVWNKALQLRDTAREQILKHNGEPDLINEKMPF